ncbi:DNA methyltransferase 3 [Calliopsis andreniformis]|uniref:DNA methyltransferase 3 n=1 Tax=Calliopsis andreniformis TaxID=337506 RepID=UPI003FCC9FE2
MISPNVDIAQVSERKKRGGRDSVKSWAEKSVWSLVCAMELGLISEPSLKSVPFGAFPSDGSLVKTGALEFPSINSPIDVASRPPREALRFTAKMSAQTSRKPLLRTSTRRKLRASKSTTAERNIYGNWDRELDCTRNTTVNNFWKSCKRKLDRRRKRRNRDCPDLYSNVEGMDRDRFCEETQRVDLSTGNGYQAYPTLSRASVDKKPSSHFQRKNVIPRVSGRALHLHDQERPVSKGCAKRKRGRKSARIVENIKSKASSVSIRRHDALSSLSKLKRKVFDNNRWEYSKDEEHPFISDSSAINDRLDGYFNSLPIDHELPSELVTCNASATNTKDNESNSRSSVRSFIDEDGSTGLADVDGLPLAERTSNGSKSSMEIEENCSPDSGGENERNKYLEASSSGSNDCRSISTGREANDVDFEEQNKLSTSVVKHRRRRKMGRSKDRLPSSDKTEKFNEAEVRADDDGSRCRSTEKQLFPVKRSKISSSENVISASVKDAVKADTIRGKIFGNDEEYHDIRRVTRGLKKITKKNFVGKLVRLIGKLSHCLTEYTLYQYLLVRNNESVNYRRRPCRDVTRGREIVGILDRRSSHLLPLFQLNEKTQIESFSNNLKYRLTQTTNVARVRAIDATMQILRKRLSCTLTKPYSVWIENNFSQVIETLDELKFYPYPGRIQQRLDHLKEKNAKITEKYLLDQKRENQAKKAVIERPKESTQQSEADLARLPLREQHPGVITWAKIAGHNWWPAMIIDYRDCCMREPSFGCQWIMWYGDYQLSEIHHQLFLKFDKGIEKLRDYINNTKKHVYLTGVLQASKDYCFRLGCETDNWTLEAVFKYFSKTNHSQPRHDLPKKSESMKIYDKYSAHIVKKLNELKNNPNIDDKRAQDIKNSDDLRSITNGKISVESLCLKCLNVPKGPVEAHPFFDGLLCKDCSEQYKPCMFVFGNDAKCFYCTVCASSGTVIICDNEDCPRVYCTACMKHLLCPTTYEEVLLKDPWECFLCKSKAGVFSDTIVKPRPNWKNQIIDMFRTNSNSNTKIVERCDQKRKIRVLSLFDGLSTGLLVLLKLGLDVDVYYASEIDSDALLVSATHFGDRVIHLGDVREITKEKIMKMAPIDLLIGGSPCNDLSLANPARLGLYDERGTGVLFFEYCRIMKLVQKFNNGRRLFWLYENVASMPTEYRLEINKHLGQEPDVIDSADFSPQHRLRLYWHNLPIEPHALSCQNEQDVQDILTPHCQRYALVKKIRTVTTKVNSLKQGKLALKPILMKNESDSLWITELEEIFGFPRHYTDVKNLSATKRQRLIGKSWSVQTLTAILKSLCSFFECNTIQTN